MSDWKEQYDRVVRHFERLRVQDQKNRNDFEDHLWCFLINCWHLKDWVERDKRLPRSLRRRIIGQVLRSDLLVYCGCVANGRKHLIIGKQRKRRTTKGRKVATALTEIRLSVTNGFDGSETPPEVTFNPLIVMDNGRSMQALDFARESLEEWKRILGKYKRAL